MTKSLPSQFEGESNIQAFIPFIVMMSCEDAANQPWLGVPPIDYCFNGSRTQEMSEDEFEALSDLWERRNDLSAFLGMMQQQVVLDENTNTISQMEQQKTLYYSKYFPETPTWTDLNMEKT